MEDFGVGRTAPIIPQKVVSEPTTRSTRQRPDDQLVDRQVKDGATVLNNTEALASDQASLVKDRGLPELLKTQPREAEERTILEEAREVSTQMNQVVTGLEVDVRFRVSENRSGETVVEVFDRDSGKVLRTIPPEEVLALRERMKDVVGLIIDRVV